jgi:hypothetical protein
MRIPFDFSFHRLELAISGKYSRLLPLRQCCGKTIRQKHLVHRFNSPASFDNSSSAGTYSSFQQPGSRLKPYGTSNVQSTDLYMSIWPVEIFIDSIGCFEHSPV